MFDIGWPELLIVGGVTLIAVGPQELPKIMRAIGSFTSKARRMFLALEHHMDSLEYEAKVAKNNKDDGKHPAFDDGVIDMLGAQADKPPHKDKHDA